MVTTGSNFKAVLNGSNNVKPNSTGKRSFKLTRCAVEMYASI
jgi:hypothetical protein